VQRYGKDGAIDWNLNVNSKTTAEPKTVEGSSMNQVAESKSTADAKEDKPQDVAATSKDDPEADIDSDEEAAFLEADI
jgi:uracil-DNA glycosylase